MPAINQMGERFLREKHGATQIDLEGFRPGLRRLLGHGQAESVGGVVDQDINPAEGLHRPRHQCVEVFQASEVGWHTIDALQALIPTEHREFVEKVLAEHDIPPLPEGTEGQMKAAGLGVEAEGPAQVELALRHPVSLLVNALGPPPDYAVAAAHAKGVLVGALCGSPRHAEKNLQRGVDVIIAQGNEAGGHCGEISTMVLVPEVVDTVGPDVPVLAAGGIGRGRQMAAAMALGAQGVWTGSIWLTVTESATEPWVVENLLAAGFTDTVRSRSMTGKPARQIRTHWTEAWDADDAPDALPMPLQGILYAPAAHRFMRVRSRELSGSPAGQIIGRVHSVRPARDVVFDIVEEWIDTNERIAAATRQD